jgi:hypothetical protein
MHRTGAYKYWPENPWRREQPLLLFLVAPMCVSKLETIPSCFTLLQALVIQGEQNELLRRSTSFEYTDSNPPDTGVPEAFLDHHTLCVCMFSRSCPYIQL